MSTTRLFLSRCAAVRDTSAKNPAVSQPVSERGISRNAAAYFGGQLVWTGGQWLLVVILARLDGPGAVGTLTLAFALSAPVIALSQLALRQVLNTDVSGCFTIHTYRWLRLSSTAAAVVAIISTGALLGYRGEALLTIVFIAAARGLESVSDLEHGIMQRAGRLGTASFSFVIRAAVSLILGVGAFLATRSVASVALGVAAGAATALLLFDLVNRNTPHGLPSCSSSSPHRWMLLIRRSLPLTAVSLLISINLNAPRYGVEHVLGSEELGYFAAMTQLISIANLSVTSLGQAFLPELAKAWCCGDLRRYKQLAYAYSSVALLVGLLGVLVISVFGGEILGLLYGAPFAAFGEVFTWLMAAGAVYLLSSAVGLLAMATGRFTSMLLPYTIVTSTTCFLTFLLLPTCGLKGVAVAMGVGNAIGIVIPATTVVRAAKER